jgi:hypothetical protein
LKYYRFLTYSFRLSGFTPFYAENHKELFEKIMKQAFEFPDPEWNDISAEGTCLFSSVSEFRYQQKVSSAIVWLKNQKIVLLLNKLCKTNGLW